MNRGDQFVFTKAQMFIRKTYLDCSWPITRLQSSSKGVPLCLCLCAWLCVCVCSYSSCRKQSTHTCTHALKIYTCACLASAISACPWSLHSLTFSFTHSFRPIQPPLFVENSLVNGRPSFVCRGWRTLSTTLFLWLPLFGWASSSLKAHPGPTYPETFKVTLFPL